MKSGPSHGVGTAAYSRPLSNPLPQGDVLLRAQRTPLHRAGIRELERSAPVEQRQGALSAAVLACDERASLALALSLAAENALPAELLAPLLPDIEDPVQLIFLLSRTTGDRLAMLASLFDDEVLVEEAEALLLWLATERLGLSSPVSAPWLVRLRRFSRRRPEHEDAKAFLGNALGRFTEAPVVGLAKELVDESKKARLAAVQKAQAAEVLERFAANLDDVVGDEEAPRLLATVTVKSSEPKVGRNDPCPCGSGKKYKKCHGEKDTEAPTKSTNAAIDPAALTEKDLPYLRVIELASLDVGKMKKKTLSAALSRAITFRRWVLAERCAEVLEAQHGDATALRDVALGAIDCGRWDVVDRLIARWKEDELPPELSTHRALKEAASALGPLDSMAKEMLADPKSPLFELALGLLHRAPGIGICVARGLVAELPAEDGDLLVGEIERARDLLALPPGDPAIELVQALDDGEDRRAAFDLAHKELLEERDALRASLARRAEELSARQAEATGLAMRLEEAEEELARPKERSERGARVNEVRTPDEERKKLSARIEELKSLVQEGNKERAELRRQITELTEELDARTERPSRAERRAEAEDPEGMIDTSSSPRVPVVPVFSRAAKDSLSGFPVRIRKQAIELSATLSSGDPAAWRNVKQMEGVAKVWSARLGIHNRLLFRVHDDHLEVLDVVTREDLLKVLERWR